MDWFLYGRDLRYEGVKSNLRAFSYFRYIGFLFRFSLTRLKFGNSDKIKATQKTDGKFFHYAYFSDVEKNKRK